MCLYPKLVGNPKYKVNKKNGGNVPECIDRRLLLVPIGCKKCIECTKQKANEWRVRILEEYKSDRKAVFVTLTFSDESIKKLMYLIKKSDGVLPKGYDLDNKIVSKAVRLFLDRWRKDKGKSVKHWLVSEIGHEGTKNVHLHGVLWNLDIEAIKKNWQYGWIYFGYSFNEKGINYFTKYLNKQDFENKEYVPKMLVSAGIGSGYIDSMNARKHKFVAGKTDEAYRTRQGWKMALPIYLRNKIWTEEEREKLWIEKLDRESRFVLGTEIDVSTEEGLKEYYKVLYSAREKNSRLGFGNDSKDWKKIDYENSRRELEIKRRIEDEYDFEFDPDTGECL